MARVRRKWSREGFVASFVVTAVVAGGLWLSRPQASASFSSDESVDTGICEQVYEPIVYAFVVCDEVEETDLPSFALEDAACRACHAQSF